MTTATAHTLIAHAAGLAASKGLRPYVVGGLVRDQLLGRERRPANVDLAVASGALAFAQRLAKELGGSYVLLDQATKTARVVTSERLEIDIADFRAPTIEEDLGLRDFTINAMAVPAEAWKPEPAGWLPSLLDPLGGRKDLAEKRVRACHAGTFQQDPVRILRAFRFAASLQFEADPAMGPLMQAASPGLLRVAGERLREELLAILQTDSASAALRHLNSLGVLDVLFPELIPGRGIEQGGYHHLDVLSHQLEAVAQGDRMMSDFSEFSEDLRAPLAAHVAEDVVDGRTRKALIKLASLYHDVGKPGTRRVKSDGEIWFIGHEHFGADLTGALASRLRLSNREAEMVHHLVLYHLRPGFLSREPELTRRAVFKFFRDLGDDGPACLLLWWTDRMATRGPSSRLDQLDQQRARLEELLRAYFFKPEEAIRPPKLIDGRQLMDALRLEPGPRVGELLRAIEEAQAEGKLRNPDEALTFARKLHVSGA